MEPVKGLNKVTRVTNWKNIYDMEIDQEMTVSVTHYAGTARDIADRARTTIGLDPGTKEVSPQYLKRMYLCEHSPIRVQQYLTKFSNIPYSTAMHFVRHKHGVEPFVSTRRDDRINLEDVPVRDRDTLPVDMELLVNAQAIINISKKRLCTSAHKNTILSWMYVKRIMEEVNPILASVMVPDCIYRGHCYEYKSCGFHGSKIYQDDLNKYRSEINGW